MQCYFDLHTKEYKSFTNFHQGLFLAYKLPTLNYALVISHHFNRRYSISLHLIITLDHGMILFWLAVFQIIIKSCFSALVIPPPFKVRYKGGTTLHAFFNPYVRRNISI